MFANKSSPVFADSTELFIGWILFASITWCKTWTKAPWNKTLWKQRNYDSVDTFNLSHTIQTEMCRLQIFFQVSKEIHLSFPESQAMISFLDVKKQKKLLRQKKCICWLNNQMGSNNMDAQSHKLKEATALASYATAGKHSSYNTAFKH